LAYDEIEYWNSRACPNISGEIPVDVRLYLEDHLPIAGGVLDWGAGVGRMFPLYNGQTEVVAVEISKPYVKRLFDAAKDYDFEFSVVLSESTSVPRFLRGFDVALASMTLLHQRPENLEDIMLSLAEAAQEVIVITWSAMRDTPDIAEHCFNHDYRQVCMDWGLKILDWIVNEERLIFRYALP